MKKSKIGVIIILIIIILGLSGFIVYDKVLKDTNNKNETKKDNQEKIKNQAISDQKTEVNYDLTKAKELLENYGFYKNIGCNSNIYSSAYTEDYKALVALEKITNDKIIRKECSEVYAKTDFYAPYSAYRGKTGICPKDGKTNTIPYENINPIYKKLYGTNIPKKEIDSTKINSLYYKTYDYIESIDSFVGTSCNGCGGSCGPSYTINEIKSAKEIGNKLYIEVYYQHGFITNDNYNLKTNKITKTLEVTSIEEFEAEIKSNYLEYLDIYEIEFEKQENENYIFKNLNKKLS